jgi:hypothetical protein
MKIFFTSLFTAALLASCSPSTPKLTPQQQAVTDYLQKTLDDPTSYQPVSWSNVEVWRQQDEARAKIPNERLELAADSLNAARQYQEYLADVRIGKLGPGLSSFQVKSKAKWRRAVAKTDSMHKVINDLLAVKDTTRLGQLITHKFRAKNKMGGLVLDSARFEIQPNGQVRLWDSLKG